jgi:hypothetical protein
MYIFCMDNDYAIDRLMSDDCRLYLFVQVGVLSVSSLLYAVFFLHGVVFVVVPEFTTSRPESLKGRAGKLSELPNI